MRKHFNIRLQHIALAGCLFLFLILFLQISQQKESHPQAAQHGSEPQPQVSNPREDPQPLSESSGAPPVARPAAADPSVSTSLPETTFRPRRGFADLSPLERLVSRGVELERHDLREDADGSGRRERLVYVEDLKYPYLRVQEHFQRQDDGSWDAHPDIIVSSAKHLLVRFDPELEEPFVEHIVAQNGGKILAHSLQPGLVLAELPEASLAAVPQGILAYQEQPGVRFAEPDYMVEPLNGISVNDPLFSELYGLAKINAPQAWEITTGNASTIIGVIDSGVDYTHEDLVANIFYNEAETENGEDTNGNGFIDDIRGWNFRDNNNDPMDDNRHGTHVAATIAATANNEKGIAGVTWNARILPIRFLGNDGGFSSDGINGIYYATMMGAKITNNSWGGGGFSTAMRDAIDDAGAAGALFVAAAGNSGDDRPLYPAAFNRPNMISVAASTSTDQLATFSTYGNTVHLAAPGHQIMSAVLNNQYAALNGTSMASPHVAGAAALIHAVAPDLPVTMLREWLINSVDPIPDLEGKVTSGGRLNLQRAIEENLDVPVILLERFTFTDSGGDYAGNDIANPGETIALTVRLRNAGPYAAQNVTATLSTQTPGVTILEGSRSFGNLTEWTGVSEGDGAFVVELSPGLSTPQDIVFTLNIEDEENNTFAQTLNLPVYTSTEITGIVRQLDGTPVQGATVSFLGPKFGSTLTLADGSFSLSVIDGSYRVTVSKEAFSPLPPRIVSVPPAATNLQFVLGQAQGHPSRENIHVRIGMNGRLHVPVSLSNTGNYPLTYEMIPLTYDHRYFTDGIGDDEGQFPWHDITSTGRKLTRDDNLSGYNPNDPIGNQASFTPSGPYPIGMIFPFYEERFENFIINNSGFLTFTDYIIHNSIPVELPDRYNATRNKIAFAWQLPNWWHLPQNGAPEGTETAYFETIDPYTFVFSWVRWAVKPLGWTNSQQDDEYLSGQVELRSDGTILLKYSEYRTKSGGTNFAKGGPVDYIAGIQDASRTRGLTAISRDALAARPTSGSVVEIYPRYNPAWLKVDRRAGTLLPFGEDAEFMLTLDAEGLGPGTYTTEFALRTNDPAQPLLTIPISFTVEEQGTTMVMRSPADESRVPAGSHVNIQGALTGDAAAITDIAFVINHTQIVPAIAQGAGVYSALLENLEAGEYQIQLRGHRIDGSGELRSRPRRLLVGEGYRLHLSGQEYGSRPSVLSDNAVSLERFDVPAVDFRKRSFQVYGDHHAQNAEQGYDPHLAIHHVSRDGREVHFTGRNYQRYPLTYTVTSNTVLEFEFRSQGGNFFDLHAVGLESGLILDNTFKPHRLFQISGDFTESGMLPVDEVYPKAYGIKGSPHWQRFRIRIGEHYTGPVQHLVYVQDRYNESASIDRLHMLLTSSLRNVRMYEDTLNDFSFEWRFSDTTDIFTGADMKRTYSAPGDYALSVEAFQADQMLGHASRTFTVAGEPRISYQVNFQPDTIRAPGGYLADTGKVFGDRGNGLSYGWDQDLQNQAFYISYEGLFRLLTTERVSSIRTANNRTWEMEVPNGRYSVTLVVGHMTESSQNRFSVQGQQAINQNLSALGTGDANITVDVTDGRLRIRSLQSTGALAFVHVEQVVSSIADRPAASFTYTPGEGDSPLQVSFDAASSYAPGSSLIDYAWDFGSTATAQGQTATHTFTEPGNHTVRLTVTAADGRQGDWTGVVRVWGPDVPEILWTRPSPPFALDAANPDLTFHLRLATEPAAPVQVLWSNDQPGRMAITPASGLTFDSANWNQDQTVTLTAAATATGLPTVVALWGHSVVTDDPAYANLEGDPLPVVIASTEVNTPPSIQLLEPSSPWITLGEGVALRVRTQVTDDGFPFPELELNWSVLQGPPGVTFSSPDTEETFIHFPAQGHYRLRLTAYDGAAADTLTLFVQVVENYFDETQEGLVTAVRWGRDDNMRAFGSIGHLTARYSHGGDNRFPGMGNHNALRRVLQPLTLPLLDPSGEDLPSRTFLFGMEAVRQSSVSYPAPFGMRVGPTPEYSETSDWKSSGIQWQTMIHLWEKEHFLADWSEQTLRADHAGTRLEVTVRENRNEGPVRMLIKQGDTWYASQASFTGRGRFVLEDPQHTQWTPVHVAYTQSKAGTILDPPGTFAPLVLDDVRGVGFVAVSDQLDTAVLDIPPAEHRFGFDHFRAVLAGDYPDNQGPVLAWDGPVSVDPGAEIELTLRARDDGRPTLPGETSVRWEQTDGPETVSFPFTEMTVNGSRDETFALSLPTTPGIYRFRATADDGALETSATHTLYVGADTFMAPPVILEQPQDVLAQPGQDVLLRVKVSGDAPLSYQWRRNDTALPGETEPELELWNVLIAEAGLYTVEVTNPAGQVLSAEAEVVVDLTMPPPVLVILEPSDGSTRLESVPVHLSASAEDFQGISIASGVSWTSSLDGHLGQGNGLNVPLTPGSHVITASVSDSFAQHVSAQVNVTILSDAPGAVSFHPGTSLYTSSDIRYLELADMNNNVGVRSTQRILQTFQVEDSIFLDAIHLVLNNLNDGRAFRLRLHDLGPDADATSLTHTQVEQSVMLSTDWMSVPAGTKNQTNPGGGGLPSTLRWDLAASFTLTPGRTYAFSAEGDDADLSSLVWRYVLPANSETDFYPAGAAMASTGGNWSTGTLFQSNRHNDLSLGLVFAGEPPPPLPPPGTTVRTYLLNFGDTPYTGDGESIWQSFRMQQTQGTASPKQEHHHVLLQDRTGDDTAGVRISLTSDITANIGIQTASQVEASFFADKPFDWFVPSEAPQRETASFDQPGGTWTYHVDGLNPNDEVTFALVIRRTGTERPVRLILNQGLASEVVLLNQADSGATQYVTHSATGFEAYTLTLESQAAAGNWVGMINAMAITVTTENEDPPLDGYAAWAQENNILNGPLDRTEGMVNLVRYALGGTHASNPADLLPRGENADGRLVLHFDRIADPALVYSVWAASSPMDWGEAPIWTSQGTDNQPGPVAVEDIITLNEEPHRFLMLVIRMTSDE